MHRFLSRVALAALIAVVLPFAAIGTGPVNAMPAYMVGKATLSDFNTTLTGTTSDGKHTVAINVNWDSLIKTHVNLVVSVGKGTGSLSALNGSSYTFSLPVKDFTLTANSATLDTHRDLGKLGHISAQWTYVTKSETNTCFSVSTTQHVIAAGSATFNLSFPCDGAIAGKISGSNVDSDNATKSSEGSGSSSAYSGLPSLLFTAVTAQHTSNGIDLEIGAYQFGSLGNIVYVSVGAGNDGHADTSSTSTNAATGLTSTEFGLTQYSHFASDKLSAGALTTGQNPAASLRYKGILGTANVVWRGKAGGNFSITMQGNCLNKALTGAAAKESISLSTQQATLTGSADVKTCVADTVTFGSTDTGGVISTHKGTAPAGGATIPGVPTPPTTGTGGGSVSAGGFAVSSVTPANGATGVSTGTTISATFSSAPGTTVVFVLTPATNPAGTMILQPTISGNTATATPTTPLTANTLYNLRITATGATAGSVVSSATTFTTGS